MGGMIETFSPKPKAGDVIAVWFSCGAASAVAAKKTIEKYPHCTVRVINNPVAEEHEDNQRFLKDVEKWLGVEIEFAKNEKFPDASCETVWEKRKYMAGIAGAPCTLELKKGARQQWENNNHHDWIVLGFTAEEEKRHRRFSLTERDTVLPVLIEDNITKEDCYNIVHDAGVQLPAIYYLGYPNANCFTGDTKFLTREGLVSLSEKVGETVEVRTAEKGNPWREAEVKNFGSFEVVDLKVRRGSKSKVIKTTDNHRWFVGTRKHSKEVLTSQLKEGDKLLTTDVDEGSMEKPHPWFVESITYTGKKEQMYCVSEPVSRTFTLEDNILTGNCIGCVKAGSPTYWNHVRKVHPEIFQRRAEMSRRLGAKLATVPPKKQPWMEHDGYGWVDTRTGEAKYEIKVDENGDEYVKNKAPNRIFLDELPEDVVGNPMKNMQVECGIFCSEDDGPSDEDS